MEKTPMLFPIAPSEFWKQIRTTVEEVVTEKLNLQLQQQSNSHLREKALLKATDVCEIFQVSKPTLYEWLNCESANQIDLVVTDQLSSTIIKGMEIRYRPSNIPGIQNLLHYVNNYHGGLYGFVSGHATNVSGLTIYLTLITKQKIKWLPYLLFAWALLICYSRIYLCVHFPGDVFGGIFFGSFTGWMFALIYQQLEWKFYKHKT